MDADTPTALTQVTRTPVEWQELTGIVVLDPDGWDRANFAEDWLRPLTLRHFIAKASRSTASGVDRVKQILEDAS